MSETPRLSPKQVSHQLKEKGFEVSAKTIWRMCVRKQIKGAVQIGREWFIPPEAVQDLMEG
ncbi:MAG: helix-turn-helix domain-containing protein [Fuerstiella sp.]|nr:helix-turn-helix domain-containing protein [Fuerstiella sp.]